MKRIMDIMHEDIQILNQKISPHRLIVRIREGKEEDFPNDRDYAYAFEDENENYIVVFSSKMSHASEDRIRAIMRHEMSHALHFLQGDLEHSEQDTDDLAEEIWGDRISYDHEDLQTLNHGQYPRPAHLPK